MENTAEMERTAGTETIKMKSGADAAIRDAQKLRFESGPLGFEDEHEFALIPSAWEPFSWMQSLLHPSLAFLVVDPFLVRNDYEMDIDDASLEAIGITSPSDIAVLCIVTVPVRNGENVTVNLQGPLIINSRNRRCFQAVLHDPKWTTKHAIPGAGGAGAETARGRGGPC